MGLTAVAASLVDKLSHEWCDAFEVFEMSPSQFVLSTPFAMGGDDFPITIQHGDDGWEISDLGQALSALPFDLELTEAKLARLTAELGFLSVDLSDHTLVSRCGEFPTVEHIGRFVSALSVVQVLPASSTGGGTPHFRTSASAALQSRLLTRRFETNWAPPFANGKSWASDLMIPTSDARLTMFFVSTSAMAERVTSTMFKYRQVPDFHATPRVVARKGALTSKDIDHLQDAGDGKIVDFQSNQRTPISTIRWLADHEVPVN